MPKKVMRFVAAALCLMVFISGCAKANSAETYPDQSIEIICPYSAGGGSDLFSRAIADGFTTVFGETALVTNKTGGNGQVGAAYVLGRKEDPYTLMSANSGDVGGWMDAQIDYFDFMPISTIAYDVNALIVSKDCPYQTLDELVEAALADPKSVVFGGTILGSINHVTTQVFFNETGIQSEYVPFEGGGDVINSLLGNHITASWTNPSVAIAQLEAGNLRALAMAADERLPSMPDVPTVAECGFDMVTFAQFRGLVANKDTDPAIAAKLNDAMKKVSESDAFKEYAASRYWVVTHENPDEMKATIEMQDKLIREVLGKPPVEKYEW